MPQPPWFSHNEKCFNGQDCESERGTGGAAFHPAQRMFSSALRSSYRHSEDENQSKGRFRLSCQFIFGSLPFPVEMYFIPVYTKSFSSNKGNLIRPFPFGPVWPFGINTHLFKWNNVQLKILYFLYFPALLIKISGQRASQSIRLYKSYS